MAAHTPLHARCPLLTISRRRAALVCCSTNNVPVFPEIQSAVQFEVSEASFSCFAPGEMLLKLHDDNWLHANVDGASRVHLGGPWSGSSTHRALLSHGSSGAPVLGADGGATTIVFRIEPLDCATNAEEATPPPCVAAVNGRCEVAQAMAAATDTIELFKTCGARTQQFPRTMSLLASERSLAEDIVRIAAQEELHEGETVGKCALLAYMARDAFGKHPDVSAFSPSVYSIA